ncbi:hypothetical protein E2C01_064143 [Portunus trituberculatus]|uniref:Uncharacterized protein n=1 Tax=Portunus trituberculatus TaxID=210409 RepID=A0A5B7HCA7_PORTR|nr:hypothetical protein [Portunus trituberculatus]
MKKYASMPDTITSVMCSAHRDGSLTRKQNSFQEKSAQYLVRYPLSWQRQNARGTFTLGDPEEELEK